MKTYYTIMLAGVLFILITSFKMGRPVDDEIPYPEGYRRWMHIKSVVVGPEHPNVKYRGFNHVYGNEKAVEGYTSGNFPDGSSIVFDVVEVVENNNYTSEVKRHHMDVMVKDSVKFLKTGGWGYAQFESDNSPRMLTLEQKVKCFNCHIKQKDHVFTELRK